METRLEREKEMHRMTVKFDHGLLVKDRRVIQFILLLLFCNEKSF